jgi:hypothetical protein
MGMTYDESTGTLTITGGSAPKIVAPGVADASVAATGSVGEYIESTVTADVTGSTTTLNYTDSGASVTLTAGDWELSALAHMSVIVSTLGAGAIGAITIYNSTDATDVGFSWAGGSVQIVNGNGMQSGVCIPVVRVNLTATKTFKIRFAAQTLGGGAVLSSVSISASASRITRLTARRIR